MSLSFIIRKSLSFQGLEFLLTAQQQACMQTPRRDTGGFLITMMNNISWLISSSFYQGFPDLIAQYLFFFKHKISDQNPHLFSLEQFTAYLPEQCPQDWSSTIYQAISTYKLQTLTTERCCYWPVGHVHIHSSYQLTFQSTLMYG